MAGVVTLNSDLGQQILQETTMKNQQMIEHYTPCNSHILSGAVSLALLFNALRFVNRIKLTNTQDPVESDQLLQRIYNRENILITAEEVLQISGLQNYLQEIKFSEQGMSLGEMNKIAALYLGFGTTLNFAKNTSLADEQKKKLAGRSIIDNVDELKDFVRHRLRTPIGGTIANYDSSILGLSDNPRSSFGVVAGYHQGSILIMDSGEAGPIWVDAKLLLTAMAQVDSKSNLPMGYVFIHELL